MTGLKCESLQNSAIWTVTVEDNILFIFGFISWDIAMGIWLINHIFIIESN